MPCGWVRHSFLVFSNIARFLIGAIKKTKGLRVVPEQLTFKNLFYANY